MIITLFFFAAAFALLAPALLRVRGLLAHKKKTGFYFSGDPRPLLTKAEGGGNGINYDSPLGFALAIVFGTGLLIAGILKLFL